MRRLSALLVALSLSAQAAPPSLIPPEPLELLGIAPDAAPGEPGAPVTGIVAVRASRGSVVRLYDAATARPRRTVYLPQEVDLTVPPAVSPDGRWLAVALTPDPDTREGRVGILSTFPAATNTYRTVLKAEGLRGAQNFAFSPDGTRLAVGNRDSYAQLWDWQAAKRLNTVKGSYNPDRLSFSPDGRFFTPHFRGQTATQLLDGKTGELINTLRGVGYGTFTPNGHFIASGGRYLIRDCFDSRISGKAPDIRPSAPSRIFCSSLCCAALQVRSVDSKESTQFGISLPSGEKVTPPAYLKGGVAVQGYSRDGERVLVRLPAREPPATFELREVGSGRPLARSTEDLLALLPDGRHALAWDHSGGLRLLDLLP